MGRSSLRCWVMLVSALFGGGVPAGAAATAVQDVELGLETAAHRVEALVAPHAEAGLFSGIVLVARGDQVVLERGFGFADREHRVPNDSRTRFGVGSIEKLVTGVLVRELESEGLLDLDTPVVRLLPGFPTGPEGGIATLRDLFEHRAGVPHRVTDPEEESRFVSPEEIVERIRGGGLLFEPGAERLYSSAGYTALARAVEVVTGRTFHHVMGERVFEPAGMTEAVGARGPALLPNRADPYRLGSDGTRLVAKHAPFKDLRFLTGAGSLYATAGDLHRLAQALAAGTFGASLADEVLDEPERWRGWLGRTNGYEASLDVLPGEDLVLVVLTNLQSASNWQLRAALQDALTGRSPEPIPLPPVPAPPFEDPQDVLGAFGPAEITFHDGGLFRGDNEFYAIEGGRYYIPASGTVMRFRRDADGRVDALVSVAGGGRESTLARSGDPGG